MAMVNICTFGMQGSDGKLYINIISLVILFILVFPDGLQNELFELPTVSISSLQKILKV